VRRRNALDARDRIAQTLLDFGRGFARHFQRKQVRDRLQIVLDAMMHLLHHRIQRVGFALRALAFRDLARDPVQRDPGERGTSDAKISISEANSTG